MAARDELRRDVMDLQVITDPQKRWDDRLLIEYANLFDTLRQAVDFLARNLRTIGLTVDGLTSTTGAPDYIAIREALVNQFIHQDYTDQTTCARVIIRPDQTVLFNAGHSLVDVSRLEDGGSSQARNPLVARAIRLIGFAEVAGSGLRLLHSAWRGAHRAPPKIVSDRQANNFTLTLDWRALAQSHDELWHRIGVKLSPSQAAILRLVKSEPDATLDALIAASAMTSDAVRADLAYLELQKLLECREGQYAVAEHLREII
jgi:predicted HTH transcriptional regulator